MDQPPHLSRFRPLTGRWWEYMPTCYPQGVRVYEPYRVKHNWRTALTAIVNSPRLGVWRFEAFPVSTVVWALGVQLHFEAIEWLGPHFPYWRHYHFGSWPALTAFVHAKTGVRFSLTLPAKCD